ncbi:SDR family oxidoreductase [Allosphingosinicella flava]|uniref:SDR family oxidoreductase n=1 Tax=Allosphingosinicella flava TaxID=2771430 RepID=A0A7T2LLN1_9SPHN|nr:SDR family oxidoreductase [Sphingosinicella flava]QPQ54685.1 SDR family oxidoreductase [Sphingosinicella flava]
MPSLLVTGANRGLGLEFVRQYAAKGWRIIATCRSLNEAGDLRAVDGDIRIEQLDMGDLPAIASFGERLAGAPLDLLVANAGTWGPGRIESAADGEGWLDAFRVNTVAPVLLARAVRAGLKAAGGTFVAISSKMGSIEDNMSGGYIAYRSSKAALNAAVRSVAIDWADDGIVAAVLHPGWVQTRMGGQAAPLTPEESVAGMRHVIERLGPQDTGGFFDYSGEALPW